MHTRSEHAKEDIQTFGGEAAVGEAHDGQATWLQHPVHLLEHLNGLGQVVHRDRIRDDIKAVVLVRQLGLCKGMNGLVRGRLRQKADS